MNNDEDRTLDELSAAIYEKAQKLERSLITTRLHLDGCDVEEFGDFAVGPKGILNRFRKVSDFLDALVGLADYVQSKVF